MKGEFRVVYTSDKYAETIAFYRDGLQLSILDSWDEGPEARGTVFQASSGIIELMEHPATKGDEWVIFSPELPKGVGLALEVENVDELYQHVRQEGLPLRTGLNNFNWGQRGFAVFDPNGLVIFVYSIIA